MRLLISVAILLIFSSSSFSQDRGCGMWGSFGVTHGLIDQEYDPFHVSISCSFLGSCYSTEDTLFVELIDTSDVTISWSWYDEYYLMYYSNIKWYRNDTLIPNSEYWFYSYGDGYYCTSGNKSRTILRTKSPGLYDLREGEYNGNWVLTGFPLVKIMKKPEPVDSTNLIEPTAEVLIYPNPATSLVTIEHQHLAAGDLMITDIQGKLIEIVPLQSDLGLTRIEVSHLSKGAYVFVIRSDGFEPSVHKVVVH